ncbi:protein TBATA [Aplochiton taeniatus]
MPLNREATALPLLERNTFSDGHVSLTADMVKATSYSSPRFGTLSHHSFFSRHNPHPHRVTHIQGLNGMPVCMVRDDWCVTSSLFPHPLLKSQVFTSGTWGRFGHYFGSSSPITRTALISEAWREELKDLAAKVSLSSHAKKNQKEMLKLEQQEEEVPVRPKTQYSAQTGRILPPSTQAHQRRPHAGRQAYPPPLYDQELMVLELLCQILQTDSLSLVQQWLLLAGKREKELVIGLVEQALESTVVASPQSASGYPPSTSYTALSAEVPPFGKPLHMKCENALPV